MEQKNAPTRDEAESQLTLLPPVDVVEDTAGITLTADLPGVSKDALKVEVDAQTLTIEGRISLANPEGMDAVHAEVRIPRFHRTFSLSNELDTDKLQAELRQGVLTLKIPKAEHAKPRRIAVRGD
jgi:HSP20 family protein